jgi:tRNA (guanine-N7-)-methyltransferase
MGRLRNAGRVWREAGPTAAHLMVPCDGPYFTVELERLFDRPAPLEVEIGAGRGEFIIEQAAAMPDRHFLAVESAATVAQLIAIRAARRGLSNLRVVRMDARPLLALMLPDASVDAYHIYFPDPWPKERHFKHRLFMPSFVNSLMRTLKRGAPLFVATDVAPYAQRIFALLLESGFHRLDLAVPGATLTGFARKFSIEGRPIYAQSFAAAPTPTASTQPAIPTGSTPSLHPRN